MKLAIHERYILQYIDYLLLFSVNLHCDFYCDVKCVWTCELWTVKCVAKYEAISL